MKATLIVFVLVFSFVQAGLSQLLGGADFLNGDTGWILWGNVLYQTTDGAESWDRLESLFDIVAFEFAADSIGWASAHHPPYVQTDTRILKTEDGGRSWVVQKEFGDIYEIFDLHVLSMTTAYSVGTIWGTADCRGRILMTRDGGSTWTEVYYGRADLFSGWFLDTNQGVATGVCFADVAIASTSDGGASWIERYPQAFQEIRNVQLAGNGHGFFLGVRKNEDRPELYATTDGFDTWTRKADSVEAFSAMDDQNILAVKEGTILRSTDGGTTWTAVYTATGDLIWIQYVDNLVAWAIGRSGTVLKSVDGGVSWRGVTLCTSDGEPTWVQSETYHGNDDYQDVSLVNANIGTAVGDGGILRTTNGGATWVVQVPETTAGLSAIASTDTSNTTAVGDEGLILRTTDGGLTWARQESGTSERLSDVAFSDASTGTVVGSAGTVLRTSDGGATWVRQNSGTTVDLEAVSFTDAMTGTAVGSACNEGGGAVVLRTTNGGATWELREVGAVDCLGGVSFTDAMTGTVVGGIYRDGKVGVFLRTTDGGSTWVRQEKAGFDLYDVCFTDDMTGTAVGNRIQYWFPGPPHGGVILHTTDGGETWEEQINIETGLYAIDCLDANTRIAVGRSSIILRTMSGGTVVQTEPQPQPRPIPRTFVLSQNYPNPFNPTTTLSYDLPQPADVTLTVVDLLGRQVQKLASGTKPAGTYELSFDASGLPSGIYFYRLQAGDYVETKRMVVVR